MPQTMAKGDNKHGYRDILAADEVHRSFGRQLATSAGGLLALLVLGLVVMIVVLWRGR